MIPTAGAELGVAAPDQEAVGRVAPRVAGAGARARQQRGLPARAEQLRAVRRRLRAHQLPAAAQRQVRSYVHESNRSTSCSPTGKLTPTYTSAI